MQTRNTVIQTKIGVTPPCDMTKKRSLTSNDLVTGRIYKLLNKFIQENGFVIQKL